MTDLRAPALPSTAYGQSYADESWWNETAADRYPPTGEDFTAVDDVWAKCWAYIEARDLGPRECGVVWAVANLVLHSLLPSDTPAALSLRPDSFAATSVARPSIDERLLDQSVETIVNNRLPCGEQWEFEDGVWVVCWLPPDHDGDHFALVGRDDDEATASVRWDR